MELGIGIKFWGTRGIISSPGKNHQVFGGNTQCIQLIHNDHLILIDTGFGAANLGETLMPRILENKESLNVHILFTHFHFDHIQGLPFFHPIYFPNNRLDLYSPNETQDMLQNLDLVFDGSYSPFAGLKSMPAVIQCHQLSNELKIGDLTITWCPLDHAFNCSDNATWAYKIVNNVSGKSTLIATDHEARQSDCNDNLIKIGSGVDLLIHDGQYTDAEYKNHVNWGHSSLEMALNNAIAMEANYTLLTHHLPGRTDYEIEQLADELRNNKKYQDLNFEFAKEEILYNIGRLLKSA